MSEPDAKPNRIRAFVALDLPPEVRAAIAAWGAEELADPAIREVAEENLHLTLCFLGHLPEPDVERVGAIVRDVRPRPVPMTFAPEPAMKPRSRPRMFAIDVDSPAAVELQAEVQDTLVEEGLYEPEKRPFWPHVTLGRVRDEKGRRRRPRRVEARPGELPQALVHTFDSVRIALYRSKLRPTGAEYVSLANLDLPPTASGPGGEG
jgi:RNA 2',3'-cyclic 3'-phosphodiesterase